MYKHVIERADFDTHAKELLDGYLNDEWTLLSHTVYISEKGVNFTRSSSGYQHVLVFQKFILEKLDTVSEKTLTQTKLDKMAFADVFITE